jgi:hypothetical protein
MFAGEMIMTASTEKTGIYLRGLRRSVLIAVALLAVFLLVRPLDCFSSGKFDQKAADCCKKGKCSPANNDDCCKATVQGGDQLVTAQATHYSLPVLAAIETKAPSIGFKPSAIALVAEIHEPPGTPPDFSLNLPLLI